MIPKSGSRFSDKIMLHQQTVSHSDLIGMEQSRKE